MLVRRQKRRGGTPLCGLAHKRYPLRCNRTFQRAPLIAVLQKPPLSFRYQKFLWLFPKSKACFSYFLGNFLARGADVFLWSMLHKTWVVDPDTRRWSARRCRE